MLNSGTAVQASIQVVRAFVRLRRLLAGHEELRRKMEEFERKYDHQFAVVFDAIRQLMADPEPSVRCCAAANSLQWKPEDARRVLEKLRDSQGPFSFDAEMTLSEFDKGRLKFGY